MTPAPLLDDVALAAAETAASFAHDVAAAKRVRAERARHAARRRSRRVVAAPAGLALLLAGGALLVRVAVMTAAGQGAAQHTWLFTAAACVLAGLALVLIALPRLAPPDDEGAHEPEPGLPRG